MNEKENESIIEDKKDAVSEEIINEETQPEAEAKVKKSRSKLSIAIEIAIYVALVFICLFIIPKYVIQRTAVSGQSMEDTLHNKESLLIDKISYRFHDPERYDIIVFYPHGKEVDDSEYYIKRVYGLPGETIQIKENTIYINGQPIEDKYAKNAMDEEGLAAKPYTLKEDEFFVLGDNREVSLDSRTIWTKDKDKYKDMYSEDDLELISDPDAPGPVKRDFIEGKAFFRIWPLSAFGTID
ncbi:MAG: signal peptidase I [Eubacterium sp.]|nr:signal peptidase I [Eubacterium sp.]MBR0119583.1 signal peptidase I [Eubacterium sp.]